MSKGPAGERVLIMMMMKATTSARLRQRKCGRSLRASTLRDKFSVKSMHAEDVRLGATETAAVASRRGEEEATSSSSTPSSAHPSRLFGKGTTRRERRRGGELDGLIAAYAPPRPPPSTAVALDPALLPADMTQDCLGTVHTHTYTLSLSLSLSLSFPLSLEREVVRSIDVLCCLDATYSCVHIH